MFRRPSFFAATVLLLVAGISCLPALLAQETESADSTGRQEWEYRVLPMSDVAGGGSEEEQAQRVQSKFNELGEAGWEFSQIHLRVAVFKRPGR